MPSAVRRDAQPGEQFFGQALREANTIKKHCAAIFATCAINMRG